MAENQALFFQLALGLQSAAWMMLGKVANPATGKVEMNLEGVKMNIDLLLMLQVKTEGNLTKEEEEFLANAIQQLQVNYVEEVKKAGSAPKSGEGEDKEEKKKKEEKKDKKNKKDKKDSSD